MESALLSMSRTELLLVLCSPASIHLPAFISRPHSLSLFQCLSEMRVCGTRHLNRNSLIVKHNQTLSPMLFLQAFFHSQSGFFCSSCTVTLHAFMSLSFQRSFSYVCFFLSDVCFRFHSISPQH